MTKDEWLSLPPALALGVLYDMAAPLKNAPMPKVPLSPRFDGRLPKKSGQFVYMSEMLLADLKWWHARVSQSAAGDGKYAESDRKRAEELARWIEWRSAYPSECWRGKRGNGTVTAAPPSRDPELHAWQRRQVERDPEPEATGGGYSDDDYGTPAGGDDLPF